MNQKYERVSNLVFTEQSAEVFGALIGDGCLSKYPVKDRANDRELILFTGHMTHDINYYKTTIRPFFIKEFKTKGYLHKREKFNCVRYLIFNRVAFKFFKDVGFPIGKKLELNIPASILSYNKKAIACIRGIFDTDGTVYKRYSKKYKGHTKLYNYLVIQFKLKSQNVIKQVKEVLENNSIKTTKVGKDGNCFVLRITNQEGIHSFMELVKPNNKYHIERYLKSFNSS